MNSAEKIKALKPVEIKWFAYNNAQGGTMIPKMKMGEPFKGKAEITLIKGWYDYETGYRFIGRAANQELKDFLARNSHDSDVNVYFSEFDLVNQQDQKNLRDIVSIMQAEEEDAYGERCEQREVINAWCEKHGFEFDDDLVGVICDAGTERLVFGINHARGNAQVYPANCAYRHHREYGVRPDTFTLYPGAGATVDLFLQKLTDSMNQAARDLDIEGKPYDKVAIQMIGQEEYKKGQARKAKP